MTKSDIDGCAAKGGCEPVVKRIEGLEIVAYDKDTGLTALNNRKVSWGAMGLIATIFALSGIGLVIWFGSIKAQAEDYPKTKEKLEAKANDNATRITKLETKWDTIENNTSKILLLLEEQKRDKDAEKIASKELKEYNTGKN
jgi:hypothetical protein